MNPFLIISCAEVTSGVFRIHLNLHSWYKNKKKTCVFVLLKKFTYFFYLTYKKFFYDAQIVTITTYLINWDKKREIKKLIL